MEDFGLVSIIMPSYNCAKFVRQTLESILAQTYSNWELLITDDCSTDNTSGIIREYADKDNRIKLFVLHQNVGAGMARNNSIREAKGRYIAFCDSDDRWYPEKLAKQLKFMRERGLLLSYTSYEVCNEKDEDCGYVKCLKQVSYSSMLINNGIGCSTAIYDAGRLGKHMMPIIRKRQDWCLWLEIIKEIHYARGLQEPLVRYRNRENSLSSNKVEMLKYNYRVYREFLRFSAIKSVFTLSVCFLPYYIYKKLKQRKDYKRRYFL